MKRHFYLFILVTLIFTGSIQSHTPKGGLGDVAVSPDGKMLVAGGDNRVLYIIDTDTLTVRKRIWFKSNIYEMAFNGDGSTFIIEDTSETLYFLNTRDWQVISKVPKAGSMSTAPKKNLVAGISSGFKKSTIKLMSMSDGVMTGQISFPGKVTAVGVNPGGNRLVILAKGAANQEQKNPVPKELKGLEKDIYKQKNDGKVSILAEFEIPSGKKISEKTIFYAAGKPVILVGEKTISIIDYSNVNANIKGEQISIFKGKSSYNYGMGISPDRKTVMMGGLRSGTLWFPQSDEMITFKIDKLPGWPEYYKGFGFSKDGTCYAVTTAYRLIKLDNRGNILNAVPVY
jgi:WD40 repeat protein